MDSTFDAFIRSWPLDPWLLVALLGTGGIYARGWLNLRRRDPERWRPGRLTAFFGGLGAIFLALASPIEPFASLLLQVHMVQHLLLTMVAPPLLWLGEPLIPMLRGLPEPVRAYWIAPLLRSRQLRRAFRGLTHPFAALPLFIAATWLWHLPAFYEVAMRSTGWHYLQHACFLGTALLFWYPVIRPYPGRPRWSLWLIFPYLILADVQNTVLSAFLTFSDRVLYTPYAQVPRLWGISAMDDQSAAGVLMWVPGSLVYLLPLFAIGIRLLYGEGQGPRSKVQATRHSLPEGLYPLPTLPILAATSSASPPGRISPGVGFDLLRVPFLGDFLRWRYARLALQLPLAALAGILIFDGLRGPQVAAMNLAGVLPWIHWRGLVILGLLVAGNVSCMACPFTLPRSLARRWLPSRYRWPRRLRTKWIAVLLLVIFLWAYDAFALWDSPRWTAWIALGYFVTAFMVDGLFRDASFCKYLCPIGQFNFVQSLISPLEVKVRDHDVCSTCRTRDCIRGRDGIPGCEMRLFQPRKSGNMDCTFCLDCVHACPHENIGIAAGLPGRDLWGDPVRSGVGRFANRPDLAILVLVLVFGAFANAAGMVGPVVNWQDRLTDRIGYGSTLLVTSLYDLLALLFVPLLAVAAAAVLSHWWGHLSAGRMEVATCFSYALIPMGFGMWLSHYSFHFLAGYETVIPAMQRLAGDLGWIFLGDPEWGRACCRPVADWLPRWEILCLDLGLLVSLYTGYRIALRQSPVPSRALAAYLPWAVVIAALFALGIWIVLQPMQMRGMLGTG